MTVPLGEEASVSDPDLLPLFRKRLLGTYSPLLADTRATLLFTDGGMANWTVEIEPAAPSPPRRTGQPHDNGARSAAVLNDVVAGTRSGIEAFLAGDLTVRGNLALALELDGLFPGDRADHTRTITRSVRPAASRRSTSNPGRSTRRRWSSCTASARRTRRCCR